ncbi:MAG: right-handed parallel beta-helix repeat-containing protein [Actinomycetota bacterium]|nr:right-handed parallel beta-helix repeat-containing protein [Actinomycetota bacterium]
MTAVVPRAHPLLALLFSLLVLVMAAHEAEHLAQVLQKDVLAASCPNDCRGLLGFAFDLEWVHFAYNTSIFFALGGLYLGFGLWRREWRRARPAAWAALTSGIVVQAYHVVEHTEKLSQWFANGHHSPTPGLLGVHVSLVELHFALNTLVFVAVAAGYLGFALHRGLWQLRTPRRLAAAVTVLAIAGAATFAGWTKRPPTIRLASGIHEGPLVLDRAQRLVGEPGTVVRGGIVIRADDVVVRDLDVLGGDNGIEIDGAGNVLVERVRVRGAELDGISVRRGSVTVRDCHVTSHGDATQGIDISFSLHEPPSLVDGCAVSGGAEGIVAHLARVRFHENSVRRTALRGITVTEMSVGLVEENDVRDTLGVAIFCGDYSQCTIRENVVTRTRADVASGNPTRSGFAIVSHFGASAEIEGNRIERSRGAAAFIGGRLERG